MADANRKHIRILGIDFFLGTVREAVAQMRGGGLLVIPAAPALREMETNAAYRQALLCADMALPDSAFMVMLWNRLNQDEIPRISGLAYLRELLHQADVRRTGGTLWVMASPISAERNLRWLWEEGIDVPRENVYLAPFYGRNVHDPELLEAIERQRPDHIIVTLGGGTQERLGLFLKQRLSYRPAIHCVGAAIAFLSGDQVYIPVWADRLYLGWFFRSISEPKRYVPRYWEARKLMKLMLRYRERVPELVGEAQQV